MELDNKTNKQTKHRTQRYAGNPKLLIPGAGFTKKLNNYILPCATCNVPVKKSGYIYKTGIALATPWNCMLGNILFCLEYLNSHKSRDDIMRMKHLEFQGVNLRSALPHQGPGYRSRPGEDPVTSQVLHIMMKTLELPYGQRDSSLMILTSAFPQKETVYSF